MTGGSGARGSPSRHPLHVVQVGVDLDPLGRDPIDVVSSWHDFGRIEAIAADTPALRITCVQASWRDERREFHGIDCHFVRETKPVWRLPGGRAVARIPRRLLARVKELDPDVVHFNGLEFPRQLSALRTVLPDRPIVAQDHASQVPRGWRRRYMRWGLKTLDAVMFCARSQALPFKRAGALREDLPVFEVLEVSSSFSPGDQIEARADTHMEGDPCLFWLGHLDPNKDPLMVLDAVAAAAPALPGVRLYMCFRGAPLLEEVRGRIENDPALRERVTLLGPMEHAAIERCLRSADFLVQGSHREGSGYGVIEALACGTTPLVTDIPAFRRITGEGRFGGLVPVGDSAALAREIGTWNRLDRAALRLDALGHFERELSIGTVGRQLRDAYFRVGDLANLANPANTG